MLVTGLGQCSLDYLSLVDVYPQVDTKKEVLEWHEQGGGPVATALVALSRLGVSCRFYGMTGDDEAGGKIRQSLADEGLDVQGLVKRTESASQLAFIAVEKSTAKRTIFWRRPSGKVLQPDELGEDFLLGSNFLLIDGLMMDASFAAVKKAKEMHVPVMLDAGSARPGILELARLCDYVVASEVFAEGLGWELMPESLLKEYVSLGVTALTVTHGEGGSITVSDDRIIRMPAFTVEAVDTTGAGDVFHAGYIYGLLQEWDLERVVRFASALAAMKCLQMGGRKGIPCLADVMQFLRKQGG
ncbi:MAG: carbohydrate kinase, PfkB family [Nitrospirae bacterium]|nr:carbohydrate kinase, PfkB family [Nitrospirota bacterium]